MKACIQRQWGGGKRTGSLVHRTSPVAHGCAFIHGYIHGYRLCVSDHCSQPGGRSTPVLCTRGRAGQAGCPLQGWFSMAAAERQVSAAQQSPGSWRGGARGREGGEEPELGAVNRLAFYGVREFISGHSPDGCNKLVKRDPPPGAAALARQREERGVGIPGHSPDIPLIPRPLPPASLVLGKSMRSPWPWALQPPLWLGCRSTFGC